MPGVGKINAIQGLRGIAALLVVADHSLLRFSEWTNTQASKSDHLLYVAELLGRHGVEIFFLISGFIMTVTSYEEFDKHNAPSNFLWRRIIRIVPLYWLITALVIGQLVWQGHAPNPTWVAKSLAFIPYENEAGLLQPLLRRGWTLNYEMFFYALFAAALTLRPRRGLGAVIFALVLLTFAGRFWLTADCTSKPCEFAEFYTEPIILYFAGGIILGAIRVYLQRRNRLFAVTADNGLGMAIALAGIYVVYASLAAPSTLTYIVGILFCVSATALCALLEDNSGLGRLRFMFLLVGEASYSIYMTHSMFIDPASRLWTNALGGKWMGFYLAAMIVGTSLLGMLVYRCVEKPMLRALKRR
jgi:exopolysaccharide production protein ExoZ